MDAQLTPIRPEDREPVIDIFNHWVRDGFGAYPESPVPYSFFDRLLEATGNHPTVAARSDGGAVLGFAVLRPWHPLPAFAAAAEVSYFLRPDATGRGLGRAMLERLVREAPGRGITSILANVSSLNEGSLRFHLRNGFVERGRFVGVARKHGRVLDAVWLQRMI
jgi:phosphinothricin acetyltransferase